MKQYIFKLDYGNRRDEKKFVASILDRYPNKVLVGASIFVNNNPYALECYLFLNFQAKDKGFEAWLLDTYPHKKRTFNYFYGDLFSGIASKQYSSASLLDSKILEYQMSSTANEIFVFPDRDVMEKIWPSQHLFSNSKVFLSHSSRDKRFVDDIFSELQKHEIPIWYDKYEIELGDSISDKINEGLDSSVLGILFFSKNFLSKNSGWTQAEMNYFFQRRMKDNKKNFLVINIDLEHNEIPPLLQDYRYINIAEKNVIDELINQIKKHVKF